METTSSLTRWLRFARDHTDRLTPYLDPGSSLRSIVSAMEQIEDAAAPDPGVQAALHVVIEAVADVRARLDSRTYVADIDPEKAALHAALDQLERMASAGATARLTGPRS